MHLLCFENNNGGLYFLQGEIKLPVLMEDENHKEFYSIHLLYRPVRQMVYAILFNLHHYMYMASKNKEKGGK